ncbi:MAG TPA: hypothetical protein VJ841_03435 [Candidatus Saccharimonadales bacterium]|nr:hypothetical protein [Candidatus Saccharimonadales bacterium]
MGKVKLDLEAAEVATMLARISIGAKDINQLHVRRKASGKFSVKLNTSIKSEEKSND